MNIKTVTLSSLVLSVFLVACGSKSANTNEFNSTNTNESNSTNSTSTIYKQVSPNFDADSAYTYVDKQVAFGPRIPNSEAHTACGNYLVSELQRFGAKVIEQKVDLKAFDGKILHSRNIIGSYNLENSNRVLLFAHWDSRPFSDQDPDKSKEKNPILGANDGASGVGALLEIARQINSKSPTIGIDIIFFDAEDYGTPDFEQEAPEGNWWCLGSDYWSNNPHVPNYQAKYGILLDMVGAPDATFFKEYYSMQYAAGVVEKVWGTARELGYGKYFQDRNGGGIYDDHIPVNQIRRIPSIDIIQTDINTPSNFGWYWHTSKDDMSNINRQTLKAVGQTVLEVVYKEQ